MSIQSNKQLYSDSILFCTLAALHCKHGHNDATKTGNWTLGELDKSPTYYYDVPIDIVFGTYNQNYVIADEKGEIFHFDKKGSICF